MQHLCSLCRWYAKKIARYAVALTMWGSGLLALRRRFGRQPRVRVLMYHRFRDVSRDPFSVSPAVFARQMAWIAQRKLAISLTDLQAFLAGQYTLPDGAVLVTVDDGYRDFLSQAVPILQRWEIPAVAFIPAGEIEARQARNESPVELSREDQRLCWKEIAQLPSHGITVGSHSWNHLSLGQIDRYQAFLQAYQSYKALSDHLKDHIGVFAYPFGTRADFNLETRGVLREVGYDCAFTAQHGAIKCGDDPYTLSRIKVEGGEGLWMFKILVKGGLDVWRWSDRLLWWLQQNK